MTLYYWLNWQIPWPELSYSLRVIFTDYFRKEYFQSYSIRKFVDYANDLCYMAVPVPIIGLLIDQLCKYLYELMASPWFHGFSLYQTQQTIYLHVCKSSKIEKKTFYVWSACCEISNNKLSSEHAILGVFPIPLWYKHNRFTM